MLRLGTPGDAVARWRRRAILRFGFLGALGLAATEIGALVAPFIRVNRIEGLGNPVAVGTKAQVLEQFSATNDRPILFTQGRFFLLHAPGGIVAAYFGYLGPTKDVPTLARAARALLTALPNATMLFMCDPAAASARWTEEVERLRGNAEFGGRIVFTGYLSPHEVSLHLQIADLALLPFLDPLDDRRSTVFAALAHGVPVVTSGDPAPEAFPAVIVPVGDADAFRDAALALATDPDRRAQLRGSARRWIASNARDELEAYRDAIAPLSLE